ncbi:MAG: hypothetical protein KDD06_03565 [Phaeodactylibacter sp.]|nr:hypothetical protein [Phaeodactylibacter sp.]MCB9266913.1 hypothetical protein [Lewinellaceae bacterium]MCB9285741.1 hypothetical protein [Lewinellaceae bacterium]
MKNIILEKIEKGDLAHFRGADIPMDIPLSQALLNEQLRELLGEPLQELELSLQDDNILFLNLAAKVPVAGTVRRRIKMKMEGGMDGSGNTLLFFHFLDGLKMLDRQLISFFQKKIAEVLPEGVHLSKEGCTVDLRIMMAAFGYGHLLPAVRLLLPSTETGRLRLKVHLKA